MSRKSEEKDKSTCYFILLIKFLFIMKKNILVGIFALAFLVTVGYGVERMNNYSKLTYLALENVEALADDESGTKVGRCNLEDTWAHERGYRYFCDSRTNDSTIYPCPSSSSFGSYDDNKKERCTK